VRRGVQLVVAAGVFPIVEHAASQGITEGPVEKMQLH
jgi:hypothetical protein